MGRNRIAGYFLALVATLFMAGCVRNMGQSPTPTKKENSQISNVNPIVVTMNESSGKTFLNFHCYDKQDCYESISLPSESELLFSARFDQNGDLLFPVQTRFDDQGNSVGFVLVGKNTHKIVTIPIPNFEWWENIRQTVFSEGQMIFTIERDDRVYILDEPGKLKEIPVADMEPNASHYIMSKERKGEIIVVGESSIKQNGKHLINISSINLQEYTVETRLIPWPESVEFDSYLKHEPGKKYNAIINGITSDEQLLYYQFFGLNDKMQFVQQLGLYDLQTGNDRSYQIEQGNCDSGFGEYKGYLIRSGVSNDMCGIPPLILDTSDLHSIMDFKKIKVNSKAVRIVPFGNSFLIGLDKKIIQIDFSGNTLQEFSIPSQIMGSDYMIVPFEN